MALPFIFDRGTGEGGPDRARRSLGEALQTALEFALFAGIALAVLAVIAAIRIIAYLH